MTRPDDVYMRQWIGSALFWVEVSRLLAAKPLPEPLLTYYQLHPGEQTFQIFTRMQIIFIKKMRLKMSGVF